MRRLEKINRGGRQGIVGKQPLRNILESLPNYYIPAYYKTFMARRKKSRRMRSRKLNFNLVDSAAAVLIGGSLINSAEFVGTGRNASPELKTGQYSAALNDIVFNLKLRKVQARLAALALGSIAIKGVAKSLRVKKIAGLGPVNINV